jgi:Na+-driven multidrug efflux pump
MSERNPGCENPECHYILGLLGFTIPVGYFLCVTLKMGAFGMWIALGVGLTISAVLLVIRF